MAFGLKDHEEGCHVSVQQPKEKAEFQQAIAPREQRIFFGALDPSRLSFVERMDPGTGRALVRYAQNSRRLLDGDGPVP